MKAFDLINRICENGLDNSVMMVYQYDIYSDSEFNTELIEYFGKQYHIVSKNNNVYYGDKLLAVWSTNNGRSRIAGDPDVILEADPNDRIYLYKIE